jgi:hypothetical protein
LVNFCRLVTQSDTRVPNRCMQHHVMHNARCLFVSRALGWFNIGLNFITVSRKFPRNLFCNVTQYILVVYISHISLIVIAYTARSEPIPQVKHFQSVKYHIPDRIHHSILQNISSRNTRIYEIFDPVLCPWNENILYTYKTQHVQRLAWQCCI